MKTPTTDIAQDDTVLDQSNPEPFGVVVSASPLVLLTQASARVPAGAVVAHASDLLAERPALHLLTCSWTLENGLAAVLASGIAKAQAALPQSRFLVLCANDLEVMACIEAGLDAIVANGQIFVDERMWHPLAHGPGERFDAVYNARLDARNRHELATGIDRLLLLHDHATEDCQDGAVNGMRRILPAATFANCDFVSGGYRPLRPPEVNRLLALADVGLCLSAVEGSMRAAMQYLLAGLPLVTTPSVGGRDRYFVGGYCRTVPADPEAVARASAELANLRLDRQRIRRHVGDMVSFDRHNFLQAVNKYIRRALRGPDATFACFAPFAGLTSTERGVRYFRAQLEGMAGEVGSLPAGTSA